MQIEDGTQFGSLGVLGKIKVDFQMQEPEKGYTRIYHIQFWKEDTGRIEVPHKWEIKKTWALSKFLELEELNARKLK